MKSLFRNNYAMAVISIILIVFIVVVSLNANPQPTDTAGQAYVNGIQGEVLIVKQSPSMIKVYIESEPERYAYLRED